MTSPVCVLRHGDVVSLLGELRVVVVLVLHGDGDGGGGAEPLPRRSLVLRHHHQGVAGLPLPVQPQPGGDLSLLGVNPEDVRLTGLGLDGVQQVGVLAGVQVRGPHRDDGRPDGHGLPHLSLVISLLKFGQVVVNILHIYLKGREDMKVWD